MANQLSKKKVLITRKFPGRILDILQDSFDIILHDSEFPLSRKQLLEYSHDVDGIICSHSDDIDYDFIASCTNLKVISTFSVGYDHIDMDDMFDRELDDINREVEFVKDNPLYIVETDCQGCYGEYPYDKEIKPENIEYLLEEYLKYLLGKFRETYTFLKQVIVPDYQE